MQMEKFLDTEGLQLDIHTACDFKKYTVLD